MAVKIERVTWTFQPENDVQSLMSKAITETVRKLRNQGKVVNERGLRTQILNDIARKQLAHLKGKREQA